MAEEKKSNLEPIEEEDLALKEKFGIAVPGSESLSQSGKEKGGLEKSKEALFKNKKEIVSELSLAEKDNAYAKILSKVKKQPAKQAGSDDDEIQADAKAASEKTNAETQIQHLTDLALTKGVIHAVKVAKHLEDNYTLDMFHDKLLADEFHKALVERKLIKEA